MQCLTTAAGILLTAAIGMAVGRGREMTAVLSTVLALMILTAVPHVTRLGEPKSEGNDGPAKPRDDRKVK